MKDVYIDCKIVLH